MHPLLIAAGFSAVMILLTMLAVRHLHNKDTGLSEDLADSKRLDQLRAEAMRRYPQECELVALTRFRADNTDFINTLKQHAEKADVVEALKSAFRDQRLLSQEIAHLIRIDVYEQSHFNKLTAAQI